MLDHKDKVTNSELAEDTTIVLGIFELASVCQHNLFKDWKCIDECRQGIELSFLPFYAASRRFINNNTKRNKSPCSYPTVEERSEIERMMRTYPKPEIISRTKPIEAPPPEAETTQEEDAQMEEEEQPPPAAPNPTAQPVPPEVDPMDYKEGEGRSISPTVSWTNPPHLGPYSAKENELSSSS